MINSTLMNKSQATKTDFFVCILHRIGEAFVVKRLLCSTNIWLSCETETKQKFFVTPLLRTHKVLQYIGVNRYVVIQAPLHSVCRATTWHSRNKTILLLKKVFNEDDLFTTILKCNNNYRTFVLSVSEQNQDEISHNLTKCLYNKCLHRAIRR